MKLRTHLIGLLVLLLSLTSYAAGYETVSLGKQKAVANRVLARFQGDVAAGARTSALDNQRARVAHRYSLVSDLVSIELLPIPRPTSVVPGSSQPADAGKELLRRIKALEATGAFAYVEPDYVVTALATPSDASFANGILWGLRNTGQSGGVAGADISAQSAWDITNGSPNVIVGVVDSGIRYTHQDLASQMWVNPGEIAGNGQDDDNDGYVDNVHGINAIVGSGDPMDDNDHGTHCAGTIGAQANGGGPHVGVAWNVRLMALKFLDANGSGSSGAAIQCIDFAVTEKGRLPVATRMILNNSWGGGGFEQSLLDAITAARNAGILFVAAAGNESNNNDSFPSYPATYNVDSVVSVAAVSRANQLATFSNRGVATVHLGAPGVDIFSSTSGSDTEYKTFNGTSMAAPHVAGVAALIWSAFPNATLAEVRQRLLVGAVSIPALNGQTVTGGRLNALNSLTVIPDGNLELTVTAVGGLQVSPGASVIVRVRVTDLSAVNNATVTGTLSIGGTLTFLNGGIAPDQVAGDNVYSVQMTVPTGVSTFTLNIGVTAPPPKNPANTSLPFTVTVPPPNDLFANKEIITSVPALRRGSNVNATTQAGEPNLPVVGGSSVWWSWTAPQAGVAVATTEGSTFDTLLGVYTGTNVNTLMLRGSNDDVPSAFTSAVLFQATSNTTYHFLVDGYYGEQGALQFNLQLNPSLPNDNFANRTPISGIDFTVSGYNLGATGEANEPPHNFYIPTSSVWWEWNNTNYTGTVYMSTAGSSFDTHMAVYSGSGYGSLVAEASNDDVVLTDFAPFDNEASQVQFTAQAGRRYHIVVDSAKPPVGSIELTIARTPGNDNFYTPRTLTGEFAQDRGNNLGATSQVGEPNYGSPAEEAKSVWWQWTAPRSGNVTVTTDGSPFDTRLEVFTGQDVNNLTPIAYNDDRSPRIFTSLLTFGATEGVTYRIRADGYYWESRDPFTTELEWFWIEAGSINLLLSLDGASRLAPPELRDDNTLSLELFGEPERPYVLSTTSNFVTWTPVSTNTPISRRLLFSQPVNPGGHYFRAQPASLVGSR